MGETIGQIIAGQQGNLVIRQKSKANLEVGELLVSESNGKKTIMQVFDLKYGSQIPVSTLEMMSGMQLEGYNQDEVMEKDLRNYVLAIAKPILEIDTNGARARMPKAIPEFFSNLRRIQEQDLSFLETPKNPLYVGNIRSGSTTLPMKVYLDGEKAFSHHILIPATTGRGKSNLVKVMISSVLNSDYCGLLVLDPHDEYHSALKNHEHSSQLEYYSSSNVPGSVSLQINLRQLKPWHLQGIINLSDAQQQALNVHYNEDNENWLSNIMNYTTTDDSKLNRKGVMEGTISVLKRKVESALGLQGTGQGMDTRGTVFSIDSGETTIKDICNSLENGKTVIIDTSKLNSATELLVGGMVANHILERYKKYKETDSLKQKPVISIMIEEAPRVLSQDALSTGNNIYGTIAREGRKFKIGLTAITQMSSVIPKEILANMNTKIILGNEMASERRAIMDSASQDLSTDDKVIASLDKGEAIVSSVFTKFALPIMIPLHEENKQNQVPAKFVG